MRSFVTCLRALQCSKVGVVRNKYRPSEAWRDFWNWKYIAHLTKFITITVGTDNRKKNSAGIQVETSPHLVVTPLCDICELENVLYIAAVPPKIIFILRLVDVCMILTVPDVQVWIADFRQYSTLVQQSSLCHKDLTLCHFVVSSTSVRRARVINWKSVCWRLVEKIFINKQNLRTQTVCWRFYSLF